MNNQCQNSMQICVEKKLAFSKPNGLIHFANLNEILFIRAQRNYCTVTLSNGDGGVICKPLKKVSEKLCHIKFVRCHRSYLVNISYITGASKKDSMLRIANKYEIKGTKEFINDLIEEIVV